MPSDTDKQVADGEVESVMEEELIKENCIYINKFFENLGLCKFDKMTPGSLSMLEQLRVNFDKLKVGTSDDGVVRDDVRVGKVVGESRSSEKSGVPGSNVGDKSVEEKAGVVSKLFKNKCVADGGVGCDSTSSSMGESSSGSDSSSSASDRKALVVKKKCSKHQSQEIDDLKSAICRLDFRKVAEFERFDEKSGEKLKRYLRRFEAYCEQNIRGDSYAWIGVLEGKLSGQILKAFKSMRDVEDSYTIVKDKLLLWFEDMKELRKRKSRRAFGKATFERGESLYLYSNKLERLYRVAYPKHKVEHSSMLRDKFISTIPRRFRSDMSSQVMKDKMRDRKVRWSAIQKVARFKDVEREVEEDSEEETISDERDSVNRSVVINVGHERKKKDAACQSDFSAPLSKSDDHSGRMVGFRMSDRSPPAGEFTMRPPVKMAGRNITCTYCRRYGHGANECRSRMNACFACGQQGHYIRDCNWRRGVVGTRSSSREAEVRMREGESNQLQAGRGKGSERVGSPN